MLLKIIVVIVLTEIGFKIYDKVIVKKSAEKKEEEC